MKVVIAHNNGPVRMEWDNFVKSGFPLHVPNATELKVASVIADGEMKHFIVDEAGADAFGNGFKLRDDALLILSEIRNGWTLTTAERVGAVSTDEPKLPLGDTPKPPATVKVVKVGKVWMILDAENNPVVQTGFTKEADAYEHMLKS